MAANGVSSPTKNPIRRNTAMAASSSSAGTPAASSASIEGEMRTDVGVVFQNSGCTPEAVPLDREAPAVPVPSSEDAAA